MNPYTDIKGLLCIDFAHRVVKSNLGYLQHYFHPHIENFNFDCILDANYLTTTSVYKEHAKPVRTLEDLAREIQDCNISKWLVVGAAWQMCIHENLIGFKSLGGFPDLEFYTAGWCIQTKAGDAVSHKQFEQDHMVAWQRLERPYREFYKLLGAK